MKAKNRANILGLYQRNYPLQICFFITGRRSAFKFWNFTKF